MKYEYATTSALIRVHDPVHGCMSLPEPEPKPPNGEDDWDLKTCIRQDDSDGDHYVLWFWQRPIKERPLVHFSNTAGTPSTVRTGDKIAVAGIVGKVRKTKPRKR